MAKDTDVKVLFSLSGRVAMVTGAVMGIGYEIAQGFLEVGATVVLTSRDGDKARQVAERLSKHSDIGVTGMALDVCDPTSVTNCFSQVEERFGQLDVLVNNAGGAPVSDCYHLWDRSLEDWKYVIDTNLTGTFLCSQAAARMMMPRKSGSIINIASIAGLVGRDRRMYEGLDMRPNLVDYAACKAGILGFTRDAAADLAPYGIRVNSICPGGIEREQPAEFIRHYADATALGRMGIEERDIKGTAVLLASDAGAYINGANIVVDGGFTVFK